MSPHADYFRLHSAPLEPVPTGESPRLEPLDGIRSVLWDIYGTMLISVAGSGPLRDETAQGEMIRQAFSGVGALNLAPTIPPEQLASALTGAERSHHGKRQAEGVEFPEVEVREVWRDFLALLAAEGWIGPDPISPESIERLVVAHECATNPVWPMPGLTEMLSHFRGRGIAQGIVSNAQFYTPHLFPALLSADLDGLGFDPRLQVFSYQCRESKPSPRIFQIIARELGERTISPREVLFIGNDLRNDVRPARVAGFRTALFAGDARSLRWRRDDPSLSDVVPDLIITDLRQLPGCLP